MSQEKGNYIYSEHYYKQALSKIEILKKKISEEKPKSKPEKPHPVISATENLHFINGVIKPLTSEFFDQRKPTKKLMFTPTITLDFSRLFYNPQLQRLQVHIPKIGDHPDIDLNEDSLRKLWNDESTRYSVNLLANLSKEKIIQKFENYILNNK